MYLVSHHIKKSEILKQQTSYTSSFSKRKQTSYINRNKSLAAQENRQHKPLLNLNYTNYFLNIYLRKKKSIRKHKYRNKKVGINVHKFRNAMLAITNIGKQNAHHHERNIILGEKLIEKKK